MPPRHYSPIAHHAYSVFLNHDPSTALMAMFTAYFDASGTPHNSRVLFVSGFASTVKKWLKFENEWLAALDREGLEPPFHMADFMYGAEGTQYESWKGDDARRLVFLKKLIKIVKRYTRKSFSTGVLIDDYKTVATEYKLEEHDVYPYTLGGLGSIEKTIQWMTNSDKLNHEIEFIFEDGDLHQDNFYAMIQRYYPDMAPAVSFRPKVDRKFSKAIVPFQAGDMVAWQHARLVSDRLQGITPRLLACMDELERMLPREWGILNAAGLRLTCTEHNVPKAI